MLAGAQRLVGMVIRNDEQDVRFFILSGRSLRHQGRSRQQRQCSGEDGF